LLDALEISGATVRLSPLNAKNVALRNVTVLGNPWTRAQRTVHLERVVFGDRIDLSALATVHDLSIDFVPQSTWISRVRKMRFLKGASGSLPPMANDVLEFDASGAHRLTLTGDLRVNEVRYFPSTAAVANFHCYAATVVQLGAQAPRQFFCETQHVTVYIPHTPNTAVDIAPVAFDLVSLTVVFNAVHDDAYGFNWSHRESRALIDRIKIVTRGMRREVEFGFLETWPTQRLILEGATGFAMAPIHANAIEFRTPIPPHSFLSEHFADQQCKTQRLDFHEMAPFVTTKVPQWVDMCFSELARHSAVAASAAMAPPPSKNAAAIVM
jgi:hypothetical protein